MKQFMKDYFAFNKSERNGLLVLLAIMVALIIFWTVKPWFRKQEVCDFSGFILAVERFEKSKMNLDSSRAAGYKARHDFDYSYPERSAAVSHLQPFPFDPNVMNVSDWKRLGLTEKQIKSIAKYAGKGGRFRCKADFKKMYCISAQEYVALESYILLPDTIQNTFAKAKTDQEREEQDQVLVELNSANAEDLKKLKGIGDFYANKIISYRIRLGGFIRKEQLLEVAKMDSARYAQIEAHVEVNPNAIRRINVNEADYETLRKHPYIGDNIALSLTNYRKNHGPFGELQDIRKSALITEAVFKKIAPYLKVE